jgi:hypothetical protein
MLKILLPFRALSLGATMAIAQVGPPTSQRTCSANSLLVLREGAVVLDTGPSAYARFVRSGAECTSISSRPCRLPSRTTSAKVIEQVKKANANHAGN